MAVDSLSTRGRLRAAIVKAKDSARKIKARRIAGVLNRRAEGQTVERIAAEVQLDTGKVAAILREQRASGDPRALTDREAVRAAASRVRRVAPKVAAAPEIPAGVVVPPLPEAAPAVAPAPARTRPEPVRQPTFAACEAERRAAYIAMLRDRSGGIYPSHEHAAAGFAHLADLFEHHPTFYPTYIVPAYGATLESTDRQFPRPGSPVSLTSSHAALCAAG